MAATRSLRPCLLGLAAALAVGLAVARGQPTYKLDVKPHLKPLATLVLKDGKLRRTAVKDDPGFRLQYHFRKDGKSVAVVEARSNPTLAVPQKQAGTYSVVLELFYPAYKGGTAQKGEFRPVSNVVYFRVEPEAKPDAPAKVVAVEPPAPPLLILCGKGSGKAQGERVAKGYGYKLQRGTAFDGWPRTASRSYAWVDARAVTFELTLPPGTPGTLRLVFVNGDNRRRKQKVTVQGKDRGVIENFAGAGKELEVTLMAADTKTGKVAVSVTALNPAASAAISLVAFVPTPARR
jgi:hypothetical protein